MMDIPAFARRIPKSASTILLALLFAAAACAEGAGPSPSAEPEPVQGRLVSIGGGLSSQNEAVYREILDGREGEGPVCVIPTAGANPEGSMESAVGRLDRWGGEGTATGILISTENPESAEDPEVAERIRGCSGFFFTGGVQSRIVEVFRPEGRSTPASDALMERFREGAVVSGSSAGAAMMSQPMIAGGNSAPAFREGTEGGVRLAEGMGFLPTLLVDQHFLARGRIGRLIVAVVEDPGFEVGAGIDENTALVIEGDRAWVTGASGVVLVDATQAVRGEGSPAAASGVRLELLGDGDVLDLRTLEVTAAEGKTSVGEVLTGEAGDDGDEEVLPDYPQVADEEIFERWTLLHVFHRLASEGERTLDLQAAGHRIQLRTADDRRGVAFPEEGVQGTPHGLSVGPLDVEITPLQGDPPAGP